MVAVGVPVSQDFGKLDLVSGVLGVFSDRLKVLNY